MDKRDEIYHRSHMCGALAIIIIIIIIKRVAHVIILRITTTL